MGLQVGTSTDDRQAAESIPKYTLFSKAWYKPGLFYSAKGELIW
jgi:hypothetical protein